ncbi:MAG: SO_0444 family Cu/Zn efflux transporter [Nitrospinae bacterium]|nr:SO_0444 family Cu/Zn efflux transporter [Nitrospinota bacterium]
MDFLIEVLLATWDILRESAMYVLAGFFIAGILKAFMPFEAVKARMGGPGLMPVFRAAVYGVPLPLCSCGVLPAAFALKKMGASKGATTAFLISTPETGVDSIAISLALLDPVIAIFRPIAAFITAFSAGALENYFGDGEPEHSHAHENGASCCSSASCELSATRAKGAGIIHGLRDGVRFAFVELMDDLALWLTAGLVLAGIVNVITPPDFFERAFGGGVTPMLVMLVAGIPMYICASASTPLAAAMILKGLSPGAALVFMLSGPATNIVSIATVRRVLGLKSTVIYLAAIAVCAVAMGITLDMIYAAINIDPLAAMGQAAHWTPAWLETIAAITFLALTMRSVAVKAMARLKNNSL